MADEEKKIQKLKGFWHHLIDVIISPFYDEDSVFSWRKGMTAVITFIFAYACIGYLHYNNFDPLPSQYNYLIMLIFVAYFGKDVPQGFIDIGSKYIDLKIEQVKNQKVE